MKWTDEGIEAYQDLVLPHLERLQNLWLSSPSKNNVAMFLESSTDLLTSCAKYTNKFNSIKHNAIRKSRPIPRNIYLNAKRLRTKWKKLKELRSLYPADSALIMSMTDDYKTEKTKHRREVRSFNIEESIRRDDALLLDPKATYASIRRSKKAEHRKLNILKVGNDVYEGDEIPHGFYHSILHLKTKDIERLDHSTHYNDFLGDYDNIIKLCRDSPNMPTISESKALSLLHRLKPDVADFYSVTPKHYLFAGPLGIKHFTLLLNTLLENISNISITEVNRAYAVVLFKGHGKDRSSSSSYRICMQEI